MADDDQEYSEEEEEEEERETVTPAKIEEKRKDEPKKEEQTISEAELAMEQKLRKKKEEEEAMWTEYIEQRKVQRAKEEDDLKKLKERQMKRKERRAEEEKKMMALRKHQEAQRVKEMEEKREREAEAKRKRLEEAERKRQALKEAMMNKAKLEEPVTPNFVINKKNDEAFPGGLVNRNEVAKTKEQLAEDKRIALAIRVKPLKIEGISVNELRKRAEELWSAIIRLESERYDLETRQKRQEYDLKELSERQRQINRSKALKKGLDPDAFSGKFPPMINVASKYERRLDRRSFIEKKSLYEGGYATNYETQVATQWEEKIKSFKERGPSKLLKWDPNAPKVKETTGPHQEDDYDNDVDLVGPPFLSGEAEEELLEMQNGKEEPEEEEEEEEDEEEEEEEEEEE